MAKHGFGIIGCGMISEFHTRAINDIPDADVVAAFTRSPSNGEKVKAIAAEGGAECAVYDDLAKMLEHPGLDVVCVCTPSGAHLDPAVQSARAGKHVVVEKPLEVNLARCDAIIEACEAAGTRLCTIFPSRFTPGNLTIKRAIDSGRFGKLTLGDTYVKWWRSQDYYDSGGWRGTWELDGGGALMNQSIHNVDLIHWFMGDVVQVQAMTALLCHERIEVEDTAVALLRFANGALGVMEAATSAFPGLLKRTEIHGSQGSARIEQDDITFWQFAEEQSGDAAIHAAIAAATGATGGASDPRGIKYEYHRDQLVDFLQAIDAGRAPLVDGREGRKAVEIIRAVYKSAKENRPIDLPLTDDTIPG